MNELVLKLQYNYLTKLIDRIYKIIPLKEENSPTIRVYMRSLISEMLSNSELINSLDYDSRLMIIISILNSVIDSDDHNKYRKDIFKCINYIEQLKRVIQRELSKCEKRG